MKRVRLFAMLLTTAIFMSTIPVTGVSAAQKTAETESVITSEEALGAAQAAVQLGWVKKGNNWYYVTKRAITPDGLKSIICSITLIKTA